MPELTIKHIVSSSETEEHFSAENLLNTSKVRPWKGKPGKDASVVLKLEKEEHIRFIDIGNAFSAFIEIDVGKSCEQNLAFSNLLPTTSFMDPNECRNEKNGGRVKMFTSDHFNPSIACQKWDLVKIVSRQPFNERISCGVAFIRLVGGEEERPPEPFQYQTAKRTTCFENLEKRIKEKDEAEERARIEENRRKEAQRAQKENIMRQARDMRERKRKRHEDSTSDEEESSEFSKTNTPLSERKRAPKIHIRSPAVSKTSATPILLNSKGKPVGGSAERARTPKKKMNFSTSICSPLANTVNSPKASTSVTGITGETPKKGTLLTRMADELRLDAEQSMSAATQSDRQHDNGPREASAPSVVVEEIIHLLDSSDDEMMPPTLTAHVTPARSSSSIPNNSSQQPSTSTPTRQVARATPTSVSLSRNTRPSSSTPVTTPQHAAGATNPQGVLSGVRFTLSGFQNPLRTQIREKAVSLGAHYLNDVDSSLTHLISAFKNTPKSRQIAATVRVVSYPWINRCALEKRKLDENLFAFH